MRVGLVTAMAVVLVAAGCGGKSASEVAGEFDDAIRATSFQTKTLDLNTGTITVTEQATDPAAESATCRALGAYTSEEAGLVGDLVSDYADQEQVAAEYNLSQVDPEVVDALVSVSDAVESTEFAADVANELGCPRG